MKIYNLTKPILVGLCIFTFVGLFVSDAKAALPGQSSAVEFKNPLGSVTSLDGLLQKILTNLRLIVGTLAIIFIIIGGLMYMMSAGSETMIKKARNAITAAVIGLAIAVAAPTFLNQIYEIVGQSNGGITLKTIAENVLTFLLSIVGIIAIITLMIGGGMYMTAYGDEKRMDKSKALLVAAVIGIIVCLGSLVIVRQVSNILGG
mgnify:CR=1 FL=1